MSPNVFVMEFLHFYQILPLEIDFEFEFDEIIPVAAAT